MEQCYKHAFIPQYSTKYQNLYYTLYLEDPGNNRL